MAAKGKTNAMRILDTSKISYRIHEMDLKDNFTSGSEIARLQGQNPEQVLKTLVTESGDGEHFVCVIPVDATLDLKKAAKHFGVKKLDMMSMKKLLPLTGYIHGGCSPVGMKKTFPTAVDETAQLFSTIYVSGGRPGLQVELSPDELCGITDAAYADLTFE